MELILQRFSKLKVMKKINIISGFSKMNKLEKLEFLAGLSDQPAETVQMLKGYWHQDFKTQKLFDEFSENTITNFYFPFSVAPNFKINDKNYIIPMVIEESSVVAAAANSAKFWSDKGGFRARVINIEKVGQVHFIWNGEKQKLKYAFNDLKTILFSTTEPITENMRKRGGGIIDIELIDMTDKIEGYFQLKATFNTRDSMGANFINSCLEEFADTLRKFFETSPLFEGEEKNCNIIMAILSNYTPQCLVNVSVSCEIEKFGTMADIQDPHEFVWKFQKAIEISKVDVYRAATHNKGIYNGIDSVALATGNDFRAIEAAGHAYAAREGAYSGLSDVEVKDGIFTYSITVPLSIGTVGGLTSLHPMAKYSLELLDNPGAEELMMIAASVGLANNFSALRSLTTKGIQVGHMKMHLLNILNSLNSTEKEKRKAVEFFKTSKVSYKAVSDFISSVREPNPKPQQIETL